jgi:hypothetical protein
VELGEELGVEKGRQAQAARIYQAALRLVTK